MSDPTPLPPANAPEALDYERWTAGAVRLNAPGDFGGQVICRGDADEWRWFREHLRWRYWTRFLAAWGVFLLWGVHLGYFVMRQFFGWQWPLWGPLGIVVCLQLGGGAAAVGPSRDTAAGGGPVGG